MTKPDEQASTETPVEFLRTIDFLPYSTILSWWTMHNFILSPTWPQTNNTYLSRLFEILVLPLSRPSYLIFVSKHDLSPGRYCQWIILANSYRFAFFNEEGIMQFWEVILNFLFFFYRSLMTSFHFTGLWFGIDDYNFIKHFCPSGFYWLQWR